MASSPTVAALPDAVRTPSQRARHDRMLSAAVALAARGGYDAVQMREVAEHADVALGTLYRYFPSKVHLLVAALVRELEALREWVAAYPPVADDPGERVLLVLTRVMEALGRNPEVSAAMVRAMMFADGSVRADVDRVSEIMTSIVTRASHGDDEPPTEQDAVVALIVGKVWLADLVSWLGDRMTVAEVLDDLAVTVRTVMPAAPARVRARR